MNGSYQAGASSGSSQVSELWSRTLPSPQWISLGCPLTQVTSLSQSPGIANLGKGANLAEILCGSILSGQVNPTTSAHKNSQTLLITLILYIKNRISMAFATYFTEITDRCYFSQWPLLSESETNSFFLSLFIKFNKTTK